MGLVVENISKSFNGSSVFEQVSFTVNEGDICSIMGPSGVGKTTLLRCICNLETEDKGSIEIDGVIKKDLLYREKIGLVFQNYNLFPHLTVLENCFEPLVLKKKTKAEAIEIAMKLLEKLKIEDKANAYPWELSGGQKQRVAIARACGLSPKILCFDEPTSALDFESIEDVANIIKDLAKENIGIVVVTHDLSFAQQISTKTIKL